MPFLTPYNAVEIQNAGGTITPKAQILKFIGSCTVTQAGPLTTVNISAGSLTGTAKRVLVFDALGALLTNAKLTFDNALGAATDNVIQKLTTLERNAIVAPATNFIIFNLDANKFQQYDGLNWIDINAGTALPPTGLLNSVAFYNNTGVLSSFANFKFTQATENFEIGTAPTYLNNCLHNCLFLNGANTLDQSSYNIVHGSSQNLLNTSSCLVAGTSNTLQNATTSLVSGTLNTLKANYCACFGSYNLIDTASHLSLCSGTYNSIKAIAGFAIGGQNLINTLGNNSFIGGYNNTLNSSFGFVFGSTNILGTNSPESAIFGTSNIINTFGVCSFITGYGNLIQSRFCFIAGNNNGIPTGCDYNSGIGNGLSIISATSALHVIGQYNSATGINGYFLVVGNGTSNIARNNAFNIDAQANAEIDRGLEFNETNGRSGIATLVGGTITIPNTTVQANDRIFITAQNDSANAGFIWVSARIVNTSFTIKSSNALDDRDVAYMLVGQKGA